jgi:hypothetical protein
MRTLLAVALLLAALGARAENREWSFRVWLDDREIGRHEFALRPNGEASELRSRAEFDVRVLWFDAYRYRHEALERWADGCLQSLVASTETNGERRSVNATLRGGRLVVERPEGREAHAGCVMTFAYWNPRILEARQLLNAQTGELVPVRIQSRGEETVTVRGRPLVARHHRITAPQLSIDLWYAGDRWVALEAPAAGGRRLRYELV